VERSGELGRGRLVWRLEGVCVVDDDAEVGVHSGLLLRGVRGETGEYVHPTTSTSKPEPALTGAEDAEDVDDDNDSRGT